MADSTMRSASRHARYSPRCIEEFGPPLTICASAALPLDRISLVSAIRLLIDGNDLYVVEIDRPIAMEIGENPFDRYAIRNALLPR